MKEIIRPGNIQRKTKTIYFLTCPTCGCVFKCGIEDFEYLERKIDGYGSIECPDCHTPFLSKMDNMARYEYRHVESEN